MVGAVRIEVGEDLASLPVRRAALTLAERTSLEKLVEVLADDGSTIVVRRNTRHNVGRWAAQGVTLVVAPDFDAAILVGMVLYAYDADLALTSRLAPVSAALTKASSTDLFTSMMAALLVTAAEEITRLHVAQAWDPRIERSHNPKGRILWAANFGRDPRSGLTHLHQVKTTDIALNRLVLAGVRAAAGLLAETPLRGAANRQAFVWRELASGSSPRVTDFDQAAVRLTRMTSHYRTAVALARALVVGLTTDDYFAGSSEGNLPALIFPLPRLFERVVERLLGEIARFDPRLAVAVQLPDRAALVDEDGRTYREVRPDIGLLRDGKPVAVLDAKFKPSYLASAPSKITNADIYQMLFYQARARRAGRGTVPGAIVAPQFGPEPPSSAWPREIIWREAGGDTHRIRLVALPLEAMLRRRMTSAASDALRAAPELQEFLQKHWLGELAVAA